MIGRTGAVLRGEIAITRLVSMGAGVAPKPVHCHTMFSDGHAPGLCRDTIAAGRLDDSGGVHYIPN